MPNAEGNPKFEVRKGGKQPAIVAVQASAFGLLSNLGSRPSDFPFIH
jgi:hypothetical protein